MAGDPKFRTEFDGRQPLADKAFQQAHDAAPGTAEAARVDGLKGKVDAWFTAVRAELALFATDRPAAVKAGYGPNRDLRKAYEAELNAEVDRAGKQLLAGVGVDRTASARRDLLLVFGVGLIVALLLAIYVARLVVVPLRRVARVLGAVADGDLT